MLKLKVTVRKLNKRNNIPAKLPDRTGITGTVVQDYTFLGNEVEIENIPNQS
jgi:hypothetical protein